MWFIPKGSFLDEGILAAIWGKNVPCSAPSLPVVCASKKRRSVMFKQYYFDRYRPRTDMVTQWLAKHGASWHLPGESFPIKTGCRGPTSKKKSYIPPGKTAFEFHKKERKKR
jgi:hypothetical protein